MIESRDCYRDIKIYSPQSNACEIDLSDNTNLWGAPPSATLATSSAEASSISRYPQPYSADLRGALAKHSGVGANNVIPGCGSDEIIDSALRAFADPGDVICFADPTFAMMPTFAAMNGLRAAVVPFVDGFLLDPRQIATLNARIVYLCSPNNPTGTALPLTLITEIVENARGLVIVDEAYIDFGGESAIGLIASERVIVTRTLSKAFGLAGLRVGYGIGSPRVIAAVEKARGPYKVSAIAEAAAAAVVEQDSAWVKAHVQTVLENRARFSEALVALGYSPVASSANFVLVPVRSCEVVAPKLRERGILVRAFPSLTGIGDAVRISIGPWQMMQRCLDAIGENR